MGFAMENADYPELQAEKVFLNVEHSKLWPGDTLAVSGGLTDAFLLDSTHYSRYVYLELVGANDSVFVRHKIRAENGLFATVSPSINLLFRAIITCGAIPVLWPITRLPLFRWCRWW